MFFLHPEKFNYRGGGWSGLTGIEPREDLGDILIDSANHKTYILDSNLTIKIPPQSSLSFILSYSFLKPDNKLYADWKNYEDKMILGIRYFTPYATDYPIQETYAPLYKTTKAEFDRTLTDLFKAIESEWKSFCCPRGMCDCK